MEAPRKLAFADAEKKYTMHCRVIMSDRLGVEDEMFTRRVLQAMVEDFNKDWCSALKKPDNPGYVLQMAAHAAGVTPREIDGPDTFMTRVVACLLVRAGPAWATFCNEVEPVAMLHAARSIARCPALSDSEKARVFSHFKCMSGPEGAAVLLSRIQQRRFTLLRSVSSSMAPRE